MRAETKASVLSVLATVWFWTALIAFGAARPDYEQATKAVSELGAVGAPHALGWNLIGFVAPGLILAACGTAIGRAMTGRRGLASALLMASGVAFAGTGVFPAVMQHGSPVMGAPSTVGHVVMLLLSSAFWLVAIGVLIVALLRDPRRRHVLAPFLIVTVVAVVGFGLNVLHSAIPPLAHRPGLAQRLGFAGYFLWFVAVSLSVARTPTETARSTGS